MTPWTRTKLGIDTGRPASPARPRPRPRKTGRSRSVRSSRSAVRTVEADLAPLEEEGPLGQAHGPVDALLHQDHRGALRR